MAVPCRLGQSRGAGMAAKLPNRVRTSFLPLLPQKHERLQTFQQRETPPVSTFHMPAFEWNGDASDCSFSAVAGLGSGGAGWHTKRTSGIYRGEGLQKIRSRSGSRPDTPMPQHTVRQCFAGKHYTHIKLVIKKCKHVCFEA